MPRVKSKSVRFEDQTQNETLRGLVTPLEEHLQEAEEPKTSLRMGRRVNETFTQGQQEQQEQQINNIPMSQIKQIDAQKLSVLVNQLIAKNKINAKNAFEVPLVHLNETSDYNSMNGDNSWKKVSSALQNNNKIYGYRVDATHNFTYKMLQLVTRSERKQGPEEEQQYRSHRYENNSLNTQFFSDCIEDYYIRHLERNQKNINIMHLDTFFNVNPILEKTKRTFDQQGLKGLLLNNIEIDQELALCITLESYRRKQMVGSKSIGQNEGVELQIGEGLLSYNIFTKIYRICCINDLLDEEPTEVKRQESEFQTMWNEFQEIAQPQKKQKRQQLSIELENEQNSTPFQEEVLVEQLSQPKTVMQHDEDKKLSEGDRQDNNENKGGEENENPLIIVTDANITQKGVQNNREQVKFAVLQQIDQIQRNAQSKQINNELNEGNEQNKQGQVNQQQQKEQNQPNEDQGQPQITTPEDPLSINVADNKQVQDVATSQVINGSAITRSTNDPQDVRQVPINSVITLNSLKSQRIQSEHRLRQMDVGDDYAQDKQTAVQKWKNSDKKPKIQRKPKQPRDPKLDYINFKQPLDMRKKINRRSNILKVDKVKKLQLKKFLKSTQNICKEDRYLYFASSGYQIDLQMISFLRQTVAQSTRVEQEDTNQENYEVNYPTIIDLQNLNQTLASNITKSASIRSVKEKVRSFMVEKKIDSFVQIYNEFVDEEGYISPALCFLTVLHLSNEHGLQLIQEQSSDFKIVWE